MLFWRPVATLLVAHAVNVAAQSVRGAMSVTGGAETDAVGVTSRAVTVSPSVSFLADPRVLLAADASGTRYDNQQWSMSGGAAGAARVPLNRFAAFTLNAGGSVTGTSFGFSYSMVTALPALEISASRFSVYGGVRGAMATTHTSTQTTFAGQPSPGLLGNTPGPSKTGTTVATISRTARGAVIGMNARFVNEDGGTLVVGVRDDQGETDTMAITDRSASLTLAYGRMSIAGSVGLHTAGAVQSMFGSGALSVAITPLAAVEVNAGAYPNNDLIGTTGGHFFTLGLSVRTGRTPHALTREPTAEGVASPARGFTRLTLRDDQATRVELAGDFSNWNTIAAKRAANGVWFVDLRIPPGQYRYAFRVNGTTWRVPAGAAVVNDDFGGESAWLTVSDTPSRSAR